MALQTSLFYRSPLPSSYESCMYILWRVTEHTIFLTVQFNDKSVIKVKHDLNYGYYYSLVKAFPQIDLRKKHTVYGIFATLEKEYNSFLIVTLTKE